MFLEVEKANYINDFVIQISFNDGTSKIVNLQEYLLGEVFEPLKDKNYFKNFKLSLNTIAWENGADFAPEFLYEIGEVPH